VAEVTVDPAEVEVAEAEADPAAAGTFDPVAADGAAAGVPVAEALEAWAEVEVVPAADTVADTEVEDSLLPLRLPAPAGGKRYVRDHWHLPRLCIPRLLSASVRSFSFDP
jgi:hypothetical protein